MGLRFFALLDDIASLLDDVAGVVAKTAANTAGVIGDDVAVNVERVLGVAPARELPIIWEIARGSLINKAILVPLGFALAQLFPPAIDALLLLGGLYLAFEAVTKIWGGTQQRAVEDEETRIKRAIRTDFVLSLEIVIIALGATAGARWPLQLIAVAATAFLSTIAIYGAVAVIVKLDDLGLHLKGGRWDAWGSGLIAASPWILRALSWIGTAAMVLVAGHLWREVIPWLHFLNPLGVLADLLLGLLLVALVFPLRWISTRGH